MLVTSSAEARLARELESEHALISDLFHALNQPLASLHCALELSIHKIQASAPDSELLEQALRHTEEVAELAEGIGKLWQTSLVCESGADQEFVDLHACLREIADDFHPVAEQAGVKLCLRSAGSCCVYCQRDTLHGALFRLMDTTIDCACEGETIQLALTKTQAQAQIKISTSAAERWASNSDGFSPAQDSSCRRRDLKRRLGLAIARHQLEAAGGSIRYEDMRTRVGLVCNFVLS
jgi:signal transduction histidine kinase